MLQPKAGHAKRCSQCGEVVEKIHHVSERRVRDLPLGAWDTSLVGPRAPAVSTLWPDRRGGPVARSESADDDPLGREDRPPRTGAADQAGGGVVRRRLGYGQAARSARPHPALGHAEDHLDGLRLLAFDKFAIRRGQQYATVVLDLDRKRIVWIARGRDQEALRGFFTALGPTRCAALEAVAVDLWKPYAAERRAQCPQAALDYDPVHIVAKYALEVIDRVRVDETNRRDQAAGPRSGRTARRTIKGARRLLLRNKSARKTRAERVRLRDLLRANRALFIVYVLKDDLRRLWQYRSRAVRSRIPALQTLTIMLERHLEGILSHCRYPINSGVLEGCNNKIKVLKRVAYGYREDAYFFLKIRAAFLRIPG